MTNLVTELAEEFGADNLYGIYRPIYKYTDCGPSIGFKIRGMPATHEMREGAPWREGEGDVWFYCDDLGRLGTFAEMEAAGLEVIEVSVSSIVEGSDVEIDGEKLPVTTSKDDFWKAVTAVDEEAKFYWERDNSDWYMLRKKGEDSTEHAFHHPDEQLAGLIKNGGTIMPAFGDALTDLEILATIRYFQTWWLPGQLEMQQGRGG